MSYPVTQISLAPVPGVHNGTGTWNDARWVVIPGSVPPPGDLAFTGQSVDVTTMLFAISANVVPNWFGVAVPKGITEFGNAHIFFHPTPGQAQYVDADYKDKTGKWPDLFYYMERLGYQLDGAARNQVLIMPFLTEAAKDTGILPANWQQIVTDIVTAVRDDVTGTGGPPVDVSSVVVSSYSAGMIYSDSFRKRATGLTPLLDEVWDLDGNYSTYRAISQNLLASAGCRVIQYDQISSNDPLSFHVPLPRWAKYVAPPATGGQVHSLIADFMFLHAASISGVGDVIAPPHTGTATHTHTGTHTHTATFTNTGTNTSTATHTGTLTITAQAPGGGNGSLPPGAPVPASPSVPPMSPSVPQAQPTPTRYPVPTLGPAPVPVPTSVAGPTLVPGPIPAPTPGPAQTMPPGAVPPLQPVPCAVSGWPTAPAWPVEGHAGPAPASGCCAALAVSGQAAVVAQTAITAVAAIAAQRSPQDRSRHRSLPPMGSSGADER